MTATEEPEGWTPGRGRPNLARSPTTPGGGDRLLRPAAGPVPVDPGPAGRTGVGRTPTHQAVSRLPPTRSSSSVHAMVCRSRRSTLARERTLLQLRRDLERFVVRLAIERADASHRNQMLALADRLRASAGDRRRHFNKLDRPSTNSCSPQRGKRSWSIPCARCTRCSAASAGCTTAPSVPATAWHRRSIATSRSWMP